MASSARVVCWQNHEEWLHVYGSLYNFDDPEAQRRGIHRVAVWKSRSMGKLPLAIECTANLISAHLGSTGNIQERLTLAMAIVRFVNGMVDQDQKGKFARSVQSIAEEIGLPDWLVDMRHEATHANLPSIDTLRSGLRASLSWLQGEYWDAQLNIHDGNTKRLMQLLENYRDVALRHALRKKKTSKVKTKSKLTELSKDITSLVSMSNLWSLLPSVLNQEGMLVPSCEQLNSPSINQATEDDSFSHLTSEVLVEIITMWKPLIEALDKLSSEFVVSVVLHLLAQSQSHVSDNEENLSLCYAEWVKHFLQLQSKENPCLTFTNELAWVNILKVALENPTLSSLTIVSLILEHIHSINSNLKEKIQHLVAIFIQELPVECDCSNDTEVCQDTNLEEWMASRSKTFIETARQQSEATHQWQQQVSLRGSTQWHLIPFGEVLGSVHDLELSHGDP